MTPLRYPPAPSPSLFHPSPQLVALQREQPVVRVRLDDGAEAWLLTRHADVRQVLVDPRFSREAAERGGPDRSGPSGDLGTLTSESLIGMDPPRHTRLRGLVSRAFTPRRVEALRPAVAAIVARLLAGLAAQPRPVDLAAHFAVPLPVEVISKLLGVPAAHRERCREWSDLMMGADPDRMREAFDGFAAMLAEKRHQPGDDLITALFAVHDSAGDRLSEHEMLLVSVGVLIGGHETTTNQIVLATLLLLEHPEQLAWLRADLDARLPGAVEELNRVIQLGDTGVLQPRVATSDVELGGVTIAAGESVLGAFVVANRDPLRFPDPDDLRLDRTDNHHLGFGAGPHHCLGASLARLELQEALRGLLNAQPDLRLAVPVSALRLRQALVVRCLEQLPVTW